MKNRIHLPVLLMILSIFLIVISCQEKKPVNEQDSGMGETNLIEQSSENSTNENLSGVEIYRISPSQFETAGMKLGRAEMTNFGQTISAVGYLDVPPTHRAEVRSFMGGYLNSTSLIPGDYVKKGQFLVSLDNMEYIQLQQEYLQSKQKLAYLKADYERKKTLADEKISSENSRQLAESEYKSMLANYDALRIKLRMINIDPDQITAEKISASINLYSPISGYLTTVNGVKGMYVEPTDVIYEMIDIDHLHVELKVFERDVLKIRKGQKVTFYIPEDDSFKVKGEVFQVGKTIDQKDRTVNVHCHLDDESLMPAIIGTYLEAKILIDTSSRFCVPLNAVTYEDGQHYVFVNKPGIDGDYIFDKMKVLVGKSNEDCIEIIGEGRNLLEGKKILTEGIENI